MRCVGLSIMPAAQARATASPVMAVTQAAIAVVAAVPTVTEETADPTTTRIAMVTSISVITAGTAATAVRACGRSGFADTGRAGAYWTANRCWAALARPACRTQGRK